MPLREPLHHHDQQVANGGMGKLLGDAPAAENILARFLHRAQVPPMQGRSHYLKGRTTPSHENVENAP